MRAISLMYHDVIETENPQSIFARITPYSLKYRHFCEHLDSIFPNAAVQIIQSRCEWTNETPIFLTFDDGELSSYARTADALEHRQWRGHFFVTTDWIGLPGFVNAGQIRELRARGHVIGSHSCSHPERMSSLSRKELAEEWSTSCAILSEIISDQVRVASVPAGYYSRKVGEAAAASGIEVLFTSEPTPRVWMEDGCLILGRYCIQGHMPARVSGDIAKGRFWPRYRQSVMWKAKKIVKTITGESYVRYRSFVLAHLGRQIATSPNRAQASTHFSSED